MGGIASTDTPTLFVWCCRPPSTPLVTRRRRERSSPGVKETQSARLNALVLESNSVTTMAESERPVARTMHNPLRLTTSPFSSSSSSSFSPPFFSALLKLPGEEQTQALLSCDSHLNAAEHSGPSSSCKYSQPQTYKWISIFSPLSGFFFFFLFHFREQSGTY